MTTLTSVDLPDTLRVAGRVGGLNVPRSTVFRGQRWRSLSYLIHPESIRKQIIEHWSLSAVSKQEAGPMRCLYLNLCTVDCIPIIDVCLCMHHVYVCVVTD